MKRSMILFFGSKSFSLCFYDYLKIDVVRSLTLTNRERLVHATMVLSYFVLCHSVVVVVVVVILVVIADVGKSVSFDHWSMVPFHRTINLAVVQCVFELLVYEAECSCHYSITIYIIYELVKIRSFQNLYF